MAMRIIVGEYDDEEEVDDHLQEEHDEHDDGDSGYSNVKEDGRVDGEYGDGCGCDGDDDVVEEHIEENHSLATHLQATSHHRHAPLKPPPLAPLNARWTPWIWVLLHVLRNPIEIMIGSNRNYRNLGFAPFLMKSYWALIRIQ